MNLKDLGDAKWYTYVIFFRETPISDVKFIDGERFISIEKCKETITNKYDRIY